MLTEFVIPSLVVGAYLLGSISSAVIVCKLMRLPDPRTEGSHNPGATNVLRIGGKKAAAITLVGDSLKGFIPMALAHYLDASSGALAATGLAAFLGHLFPIFFRFQGGKGVATALGVQFGLWWPIGLAVAAIWALIAKVVKISSLSALISMALAPFVVWFFGVWLAGMDPVVVRMQVAITVFLFWRHRSNIRNLLSGKEGRIGGEPSSTDSD
jgi:glycerol-3-phosphate acyltransferase PlsY